MPQHLLNFKKVQAIKQPGRYSDGGGLYLVVGAGEARSWIIRIMQQGSREARAAELEQAEIYPIWYPVEDHSVDHDKWIEEYLVALEGGPM